MRYNRKKLPKSHYYGVLGEVVLRATGSRLSSDNTLCTDAWRAFSTYAKSKGLEHYRFKSDGSKRVKALRSPNKDLLEVVQEDSKYVYLSNEDSDKLFEAITETKLTDVK